LFCFFVNSSRWIVCELIKIITDVRRSLETTFGLSSSTCERIFYAIKQLTEQLRAVAPIVGFAFIFFLVLFQHFLQRGLFMVFGQVLLVFGLALFLEGMMLMTSRVSRLSRNFLRLEAGISSSWRAHWI
jgi:hypothetical protein